MVKDHCQVLELSMKERFTELNFIIEALQARKDKVDSVMLSSADGEMLDGVKSIRNRDDLVKEMQPY